MNNMNQMGKAFESYLGDYAGYLPSGVAWGGEFGAANTFESATPNMDLGMVVDSKTGQTIQTQFGTWYGGTVWTNKMIGIAKKTSNDFVPGKFNMVGVNTGMLLTTGYLPDASVFYCPSAVGMPVDYTRPDGYTPYDLTGSIRQLKQIGGTDATSFQSGDWSTQKSPLAAYSDNTARVAQGNYCYRGVPVRGCGGLNGRQWIVGFTRPQVKVRLGCPSFKTTKLLGGRALLADSFCVAWKGPSTFLNNQYPDSFYAHRDGYNLLYGDSHATWFGDAEQKVAWFPAGWLDSTQSANLIAQAVGGNMQPWQMIVMGADYGNAYPPLSPFVHIWHAFDTLADIDTNTTWSSPWSTP